MSMRRCGECTLCCRLLPVADSGLKKPAGERCQHQRMTGCAIYSDRPTSCRLWSCAWLLDDQATAGMSRPDRAHYVVDMMKDYVEVSDPETGETVMKQPVAQIWADPKHPDAHRDPALREMLDKMKIAGLVRYTNAPGRNGVLLVPPSLTGQAEFVEIQSNTTAEAQHTPEQIMAVLGENA